MKQLALAQQTGGNIIKREAVELPGSRAQTLDTVKE